MIHVVEQQASFSHTENITHYARLPIGKLVDVYMGQYGGTTTIVYFMCALRTNLCKTSRWPDDLRENLVNQAVGTVRLEFMYIGCACTCIVVRFTSPICFYLEMANHNRSNRFNTKIIWSAQKRWNDKSANTKRSKSKHERHNLQRLLHRRRQRR